MARTPLESKKNPFQKDGKPPTVREMFVDRMRREGKDKEWHATVKQVMAETGKGFWVCSWEAMRRMGYTTPQEERRFYQEHIESLHKASQAIEAEKQDAARQEGQKAAAFEAAVRTLPPNAPAAKEIEWVNAHPAMRRKRGDDEWVEITAEDVLSPPHGPAPSQGAVNKLNHYVNRPDKFFDMVMSEQKKATETKNEASDAVLDLALEEVERLLKGVSAESS